MKRILAAFSIVAGLMMVFTVFSGATAAPLVSIGHSGREMSGIQRPETSSNPENNIYIVSPPVILINSIEYLENNPGIFQISNNVTVISARGTVDIYDSSNGDSIIVSNLYGKTSSFQYELVYFQDQFSTPNVTTLLLNSTNGYHYSITNYIGQTTGMYGISATNESNSAMRIAGYLTFALARIYYQTYTDALPPPPTGTYDIWFAYNHSSEVFQGNQEIQEWENVTIYWSENSAGTSASFIEAWLNNTGEASAYYTNSFGEEYGLGEAQIFINLGVVPYGLSFVVTEANYTVAVGGQALEWLFFTWNAFENNNNPLGRNIWENDSFLYGYNGLEGPPPLKADIEVPSNDL
jgi:hypothetical protein